MRASIGRLLMAVALAACAAKSPRPNDKAFESPAKPPPATAPAASPAPPGDADAGASTGHVDDGVIAKLFDRAGELIAARIRQAASGKFASREAAQDTLDRLLNEWTHLSGMSDLLADLGVKASEVESYIDQHPEVLKRQAARIAERLREPMHEFEEAIDKQFPKKK